MTPLDHVEEIEEDPKSGEMTFMDHLDTLRGHIVRACAAVLVFAAIAFGLKDFIFVNLIFGPLHNTFPTYRFFCWASRQLFNSDRICIQVKPVRIINTEMSGQFMMHIQVAAACGFIVAFPYIAWEVWRFVKPGLTRKETTYTQGLVFFMSALFFAGVLFGYFIMIPTALQFFTNYEVSPDVGNYFSLGNYIGFLSSFVLMAGVVFELPVAVYFLSKLGFLSPGFMRKHRRYAVVILLIVATIITPTPDWFTMIVVFIPLYFLYELSIFVSAKVEKDKKAAGLD